MATGSVISVRLDSCKMDDLESAPGSGQLMSSKSKSELDIAKQRCVFLQKEADKGREEVAKLRSEMRELDEMYQSRLQQQADRLIKSQREVERLLRLNMEASKNCPACGMEYKHEDGKETSAGNSLGSRRRDKGAFGTSAERINGDLNKENSSVSGPQDMRHLVQRMEQLEKEKVELQAALLQASTEAATARNSTEAINSELSNMKRLVKELSGNHKVMHQLVPLRVL